MKHLLVTTILLHSLVCSLAAAEQKLNILMLIADDLKPMLGCYGHDYIQSPNIDRLAASSVIFNRAYCGSPVCGPSRASVMTGLRAEPHVWHTDGYSRGFVSLPAYLKGNGYQCISNGKVLHHFDDLANDWSEKPWRSGENPIVYRSEVPWAKYNPRNIWRNPLAANHVNPKTGFGPYYDCGDVDDNGYQDGLIAEKTIADIRNFGTTGEPFFIACGFWRPHLPFNAPQKYWDMYEPNTIPIADNRFLPEKLPELCSISPEFTEYGDLEGFPEAVDFHRKARHGYFACISYVDALIGKVLKALDEAGLKETTIIIFLGDNGYHLGEHNFWSKHTNLDDALRVPLIIHAPGIKDGKSDSLVELVNIYPTIVDLLELPAPSCLQGDSLVPMINNPRKKIKNEVFCKWKENFNWVDNKNKEVLAVSRTVKTDKYIYTEWTKAGELVESMLFDHSKDPDENHNVIEQAQYTATVKKMRDLLDGNK